MKEGRKTMMLRAVSADAVRIVNGSNHHLLKFAALICSLPQSGSRLRAPLLVSILSSSYALLSLCGPCSCVERTVLTPPTLSTPHDILRLKCHLYKTSCSEDSTRRA